HGGAARRAEAPMAVVGHDLVAEIDREVAGRAVDVPALAIADGPLAPIDPRHAERRQDGVVEGLGAIEVARRYGQVIEHLASDPRRELHRAQEGAVARIDDVGRSRPARRLDMDDDTVTRRRPRHHARAGGRGDALGEGGGGGRAAGVGRRHAPGNLGRDDHETRHDQQAHYDDQHLQPERCVGRSRGRQANSMSDRHVVTVDESASGERLDRALAAALPSLTRSRVKALIESRRGALADGRTIEEPSRKVKTGERFIVDIPDPEPAEPKPQAIDLDILYEDSDLLVLNKPAGLVVHPAPGNPDSTLVNALLAHCGDSLSGIGGVRRPGIVHRLDKDTSGVMVVAKNDQSHRALAKLFAAHDLTRIYQALVWGGPKAQKGT